MLRGLTRGPFGARPPLGGLVEAVADESDISREAGDGQSTADLAPSPSPPPAAPPPEPSRKPEEPSEAEVQYETLKRHIHMQLVDRLDMNRVAEMDPKTLRDRDPGDRRAALRHRKPAAQPQRAPAAGQRDPRRDVRLRPARAAAQGRQDRRHHDQRPQEGLHRERRAEFRSRRSCSATTTTCCRSSTGSSRGSAAGSTRRRRWSTPGSPTARGSTRSSRLWLSTARP